MIGTVLVFGILALPTLAFRPVDLKRLVSLSIRMSAQDLEPLYNTLFSKLESAFDLKATDYTDVQEMNTFNLKCTEGAQWVGASTWLSEQKGSKLTGVAKHHMKESTGSSQQYSIDAWLGPGYMVRMS